LSFKIFLINFLLFSILAFSLSWMDAPKMSTLSQLEFQISYNLDPKTVSVF
jgi:hypothetical protein